MNDIIMMALHMAIANVIQIKILRLDTVVFVQNICIETKLTTSKTVLPFNEFSFIVDVS